MRDGNQKTESKPKPRIGVVVGSGGIKAFSSIPLFEFLDSAGIKPDLLIGCSGGGIMTSFYAVHQDSSEMRDLAAKIWTKELFKRVDYRTLFAIAKLPMTQFDKSRGLIKPDNIYECFQNMYGERLIENLPSRLMLQTTDLVTGEPVMITSGRLWDAVYGSAALFPILPPIFREGRWLIDGGYSAPVPILRAVNEGMDVIIAVSMEVRATDDSDNFVDYFMRCIAYQSTWLTRNTLALSVDLHHHEIIFVNVVFDKMIGLKSVDSIPDIIGLGEEALNEKKDEILAAISNFSSAR